MATTTVRMSDDDMDLVRSYSKLKKQTISEVLRNAIIEQIEDEYDLAVYDEAKTEFDKNPTTISHEEMGQEFGLV